MIETLQVLPASIAGQKVVCLQINIARGIKGQSKLVGITPQDHVSVRAGRGTATTILRWGTYPKKRAINHDLALETGEPLETDIVRGVARGRELDNLPGAVGRW